MADENNNGTQTTLEYIKRDIGEIKATLKENDTKYVSQKEFDPVRRIVYGLVSLILVAVVGAVVAIVIPTL